MLKKLKFLTTLYIYKLQGFLGLKKSDIMKAINDYYRSDFQKLSKNDVAVIMPHCLISTKCPAKFSKSDGVLCSKCKMCGCGTIRETAEQKGYQFYITPSVGFTKRLVQRKSLKGIIGVACDYEIEKGINSEKISGRGVKLNGSRIKTQGLRLHEYNCIDNNVDWEKIEELM
ncbi:MAG: DUF116 domain-containing protein [Candidatus Aenigmarchaeota archaeon]|nr:DUF116 domain-containing protein [Candidatus Aenigmarchaeota archaeon]